jgi:hypothetical protein
MVTRKTIKTIFKLRRALESEWEEHNPILSLGEPGFAYDINKLKIGDGEKPWLELEYIGEDEEAIINIVKTMQVEDLSDGTDYAKKEYVDEKFENLIIDCGTSTTVLRGDV